ncbi:MAG: ABC transporter substrate-binding protein [Anaerolineae bacterium]
MKLRDDIKWSDGEPITSADYVFAYEMIMSDANTVSTRSSWDTKAASVTSFLMPQQWSLPSTNPTHRG